MMPSNFTWWVIWVTWVVINTVTLLDIRISNGLISIMVR